MRLTPEDPTDDCVVQDPNSPDNPINYSYRAEGWEVQTLRTLENVHRHVMAEVPPEWHAAFITRLSKGAEAFWKNNYLGNE